jgi:hypothetical protein
MTALEQLMILTSPLECRNPNQQHIEAGNTTPAKFTYVLASWEGSAHDASISREDGIYLPNGKIPWRCRLCLSDKNPPPFRKTRFHLNEFSPRNRPQNAEDLFNIRHSSLRVTIERAFAALKNKFIIINQKPFHTLPTQVKFVFACCILHNSILANGTDDYVLDEVDVTPDDVEGGHGVEHGDI